MGSCCASRVEDEGSRHAKEQVKPFSQRGCTDIIWVVLFIAGWVAYVIVTIAGVQNGAPEKLYKPRDFSGAYCGSELNWNGGPNLLGKDKMTYTMNVSAMSDQIAKQMLCSTATSGFMLGGSSPLTATQQDEYACACCLRPCKHCIGSLKLGKGGDQTSTSGLSSTVTHRMQELTLLGDNGASFFDPAGWNGDFASQMWSSATQYLTQVCLPNCNTDYTSIANNTSSIANNNRTYTYNPSADDPLRVAWDALKITNNGAAGNLPATIASQFTFQALPTSVCSYADVYCVPFPGMTFSTLAGDYCGFEFSADVLNTVGQAAADTFQSLGGNAFKDMSVETLGTWMGDWEKSIDSFVIVAVLAFIIGVIFLVILRFFVGICVWTTIFLVFFLFLIGGGIVYVRSGQCAGAGLFDSGKQLIVAVTVAGTTAVNNAVQGTTGPSEELIGDGAGYVGVQSRTKSGYLCKDWSLTGPTYWPTFRDSSNLRSNFCRNPYTPNSTSIFQATSIWCFTTDADVKWELCSPVGVIQPECKQGYAVNSKTGRDFLLAGAITLWSLCVIWMLLICCFRSRINLAIALNKVGAQFLSHNPHVILIPLVQAATGVLWALIWALSACFLLSQVPDGYTDAGAFATYAEAYGTETIPGKCNDKWPTGFVWKDETCTLADPKCWRCGPPRYIFDVRFAVSFFMYLWNSAFIIALGQCCIAGAVGVWFFTPNNEKGKVACVTRSVMICFRYHTGSIAFGAFVLACVQFLRWLLYYLQKQAQAQKNRVVALILKVMQCCLKCVEIIVKFLNKNAYIQIALKGTSFCKSAWKAGEIIAKNILRFGVVATLGNVLHYIGVLFIMSATGTVGYFIVKEMHTDINPVVPLILYIVVGYIVGKLYMSLFAMSVDTALQCVIEAEELDHDGSFVPAALRKVLPASKAKDKPLLSG